MHADYHACSVGVSPTGVTAKNSVAWMAGRRETDDLKPIDKAIVRMVNESPGRNESERTGGPENWKVQRPSRPPHGEGSKHWRRLAEATGFSGGVVATAWWQGHAKQLEKPSSSQGESPWRKVDLITGDTGKWVEDERVAERLVVAMKRSNFRGAKRPHCS